MTKKISKADELFAIGTALWRAISDKTGDTFFCINSGADYMVILSVRSVVISSSQASIFQVYESKIDEDICMAKIFIWGNSIEASSLCEDLAQVKCHGYIFSAIENIPYIIKEAFGC